MSNSPYCTGTKINLCLSESNSGLRIPGCWETGENSSLFSPPCHFGELDCHEVLLSVLVALYFHSLAVFNFLSPIMQRTDFPKACGLWKVKEKNHRVEERWRKNGWIKLLKCNLPLNMINVPQWCLLIPVAIRRGFVSNILSGATF